MVNFGCTELFCTLILLTLGFVSGKLFFSKNKLVLASGGNFWGKDCCVGFPEDRSRFNAQGLLIGGQGRWIWARKVW